MTVYVDITQKVILCLNQLLILSKILLSLLKYFMVIHIVYKWINNIHNKGIHLTVECSCYVELKILLQAKNSGASLRMILNIKGCKLLINY
jgi:hypothetical protein